MSVRLPLARALVLVIVAYGVGAVLGEAAPLLDPSRAAFVGLVSGFAVCIAAVLAIEVDPDGDADGANQ